jgi:hypothetical protein
MTSLYRSDLMLNPTLANGGHAFTIATRGEPGTGPLFPATPTTWRCLRCHLHTTTPTDHGPCTDVAAALTTGGHP